MFAYLCPQKIPTNTVFGVMAAKLYSRWVACCNIKCDRVLDVIFVNIVTEVGFMNSNASRFKIPVIK